MSERTITFTHRVNGTLTNATSVVLSDPTAAFGVKRNDTSAVVVADGTAMTNASTGTYTYTFTEPAEGLSYTAYVEWVYNGATYRVERQLAASSADADWRYADYQACVDLIGANNLRILSNVDDDDAAVNTTRLENAGLWADAYMDARFASLGYETPLDNVDPDPHPLVTEANARLTIWKLNQARIAASVVGKTPTEIATLLEEGRKMADQFFRDLSMRRITITADRLYTRGSKIEAYVPDTTLAYGTWCQI